jgi:hypothetical protein
VSSKPRALHLRLSKTFLPAASRLSIGFDLRYAADLKVVTTTSVVWSMADNAVGGTSGEIARFTGFTGQEDVRK